MAGSQVHQQRLHRQHPPHAERIGDRCTIQACPKDCYSHRDDSSGTDDTILQRCAGAPRRIQLLAADGLLPHKHAHCPGQDHQGDEVVPSAGFEHDLFDDFSGGGNRLCN